MCRSSKIFLWACVLIGISGFALTFLQPESPKNNSSQAEKISQCCPHEQWCQDWLYKNRHNNLATCQKKLYETAYIESFDHGFTQKALRASECAAHIIRGTHGWAVFNNFQAQLKKDS